MIIWFAINLPIQQQKKGQLDSVKCQKIVKLKITMVICMLYADVSFLLMHTFI